MEHLVTAATGFKRLGIAIAAVVLAVIAALGALALLIPADSVREAVKAEIRTVTGLDLSLRGDADGFAVPDRLDQLRQCRARRRQRARRSRPSA